jgi:hypothetical protein
MPLTRDAIVQFFALRQTVINDRDAAAVAAEHSDTCVIESPLAGRSVGRAAIERFYADRRGRDCSGEEKLRSNRIRAGGGRGRGRGRGTKAAGH